MWICNSWNPREGAAQGTTLSPANRGSDDITSSIVTTRTNLFHSYSMTHAEGGIGSTGSNQGSLLSQLSQTSDAKEKKAVSPIKVYD